MKEVLKYGFTLGMICAIAAAALAAVNAATKDKILAQSRQELEAGLEDVLPRVFRFEAVKSQEGILFYKGFDKEGRLLGIAFKAQGKGYSSVIEAVAGMTVEGKILAIKVMNQNETPGIGDRVAGEDFIAQFRNKSIPELSGVQAITAATISSRAVIDAVKNKAAEIRDYLKNEK